MPFQDITDERIQEGADFLLEDVEEEDMVANVVEELAGAGAVAKKAVRRLSFSNGGSVPKKLKTSSGTAKEQRRMSGKPIGEKKSQSVGRQRPAWSSPSPGSTKGSGRIAMSLG